MTVAWNDIRSTLTASPLRTLSAVVLLVAVGLALWTPRSPQPVAEIGGQAVEFDQIVEDLNGVALVAADDEDAPDTAEIVDGREQYRDPALTHAFAEDDSSSPARSYIIPVSARKTHGTPPFSKAPVWLLGILDENE